jgi:hypothetical protein
VAVFAAEFLENSLYTLLKTTSCIRAEQPKLNVETQGQ